MVKPFRFTAIALAATSILVLPGCSDDDSDGPGGSSTSSASDAADPTPEATDTTDATDATGATGATDDTSGSTGSTIAPSGDASECWVHLYDGDRFDAREPDFRLTEPGRFANLRDLPGATQDWSDDADSIRVGPKATVTIWSQTDFQGRSQVLQPGSEHPDLDDEPLSLELAC